MLTMKAKSLFTATEPKVKVIVTLTWFGELEEQETVLTFWPTLQVTLEGTVVSTGKVI